MFTLLETNGHWSFKGIKEFKFKCPKKWNCKEEKNPKYRYTCRTLNGHIKADANI